jgi:hypothetical protein
MADKTDKLWAAIRDGKNSQFDLVDEEIDGKVVTLVVTKNKDDEDEAVAILLPTKAIRRHVIDILDGGPEDEEDEDEDPDDEEAPRSRRRFSP